MITMLLIGSASFSHRLKTAKKVSDSTTAAAGATPPPAARSRSRSQPRSPR